MSLRFLITLSLVALVGAGCRPRTPEPVVTPDPTPVERGTTRDPAAIEAERRAREAAEREAAEREAREREVREREARVARAHEVMRERVHFDFDRSEIRPEFQNGLRAKAAILRDNPNLVIRIEGHADERGSTEYNLALGQRRAESVRAFLAGFGISADRIQTTSFGKERPLVDRSDEDAWAMNRRAEFAVTRGDIVTVPAEVR